MKVFLDTNVLASAAATRGLCADVLREVLSFHELIVSEAVLKELAKVLKDKLKVPSFLITDFLDFLTHDALVAEPGGRPILELKDKDDIVIVAAALSARADLFVTGDKELLALGKVKNLTIITPRAFWERIKA